MCEYSILYLINPRQVVVIHNHSGLAKMIGSLFEHGRIMVIHEYSKFKFDLVFSRYFKMCLACWKGIQKTRVIPGYSKSSSLSFVSNSVRNMKIHGDSWIFQTQNSNRFSHRFSESYTRTFSRLISAV